VEAEKRKVGPVTQASVLGGALALVLQWLVKIIFDIDMPEAVAAAFSVILTGVGIGIGGWLVKPGNGNRRA
jgi:hypothetical protein